MHVIVCLELLSYEGHTGARRNSAILPSAETILWTPVAKRSRMDSQSRSVGGVATVSRVGPGHARTCAAESDRRPCSSRQHAALHVDGSLTVHGRKPATSHGQTPRRALTYNASQQALFKRPVNVPKQVIRSRKFHSEKLKILSC